MAIFGLGWPDKIGAGAGLVFRFADLIVGIRSSMIGRQVCFEAGAESTQGRLKVDPRPTKSRFKVEPNVDARSPQGQPKIAPRSTLTRKP